MGAGGSTRVIIKPPARFPAMHAGRDHPAQQRRRGEARLPVLLEHDLGDPDRRVQPDEVEQRERPHGVAAAELHAAVDVGRRGDALLQRPHGVEQIGHQQAVHDEARAVAGRDRLLAEPPGEGHRPVERLPAGRHGPHDLDQRHERHGIEEVEADEAVGPAGGRRHLADGEAGGVGGEDRRRRAAGVELAPELGLEPEVLGDRLDDEVAAREVGEVGGERRGAPAPLARAAGSSLPFSTSLSERLQDRGLALARACPPRRRARWSGSRLSRPPGRCRCPSGRSRARRPGDLGHRGVFRHPERSGPPDLLRQHPEQARPVAAGSCRSTAAAPCSSWSSARSRPSWMRASVGAILPRHAVADAQRHRAAEAGRPAAARPAPP